MIYRISLLCLLFLNSCTQRNKNVSESSKFYADVDMETLEGIILIDNKDYPNIEIFDSSGLRVLTYHINLKKSFRRMYYRQNAKWVTNFSYRDDTAVIYTRRELYSGKCIEFSYTDTVKLRLYDFGELDGDSMHYYNPGRAFFVQPVLEEMDSIKKNSKYQTVYAHDTSGNVVRIIYKSIVDTFSTSTVKCYPKNGRSFFWWLEFMDYANTVPCSN